MFDAICMLLKAFLVGGLLCVVCQLFIDKTKLTPARILVGFVCAGVFLGALGIYGRLVDFGGRGATVPLSGFGYNIFKGVKKAIDERGFFGIITGPLTAAAGGTTFAIMFALIATLFTKGKRK